MFAKIFSSIFEGTLRDHWQGLVTFQQLLVLCDQDGVVDMTPSAISGRTGIPKEIIDAGIAFLEAPDPNSRTPDEGGRRIVRIDEHRSWGWFITNYGKYRALQDATTKREQTRARVAKHREKQGGVADCNAGKRDVTLGNACNAKKRQAEAEAEAEASNTEETTAGAAVDGPAGVDREPVDDVFAEILDWGVKHVQEKGQMTLHTAQTYIASRCKLYGESAVARLLLALKAKPVVEPRSWLDAHLKKGDPHAADRGRGPRSAVDQVREANRSARAERDRGPRSAVDIVREANQASDGYEF